MTGKFDPRRKIIFHHIPKSGGTSIMSSIAKNAKARSRTHARASFTYDPIFGTEFIDNDPSSLFFSSHYAFHRDLYAKREGEFLFTWVRNPVDMFYSACEFYRQENRPLATFWPENIRIELNRMHGECSIYHYIDSILNGNVDKANVFPCFYFEDDWDRYDFIGVCENHEEDTLRLGQMLGMTLAPMKINPTTQERRPTQDREFKRGYKRDALERYFWNEMDTYQAIVNLRQEQEAPTFPSRYLQMR